MNEANQAQPVRDRLGRLFDALKFRLGADGRPRFDALGRFVNLRGGRKKKNVMQKTETAQPSAAPEPSPAGGNQNDGGNGSGAPAPAAAPAVTAPPPAPDFGDVKKALGTFAAGAEPADVAGQAAALADEISDLPENPTAESIIGIIQTGLVLIGDEEGILSAQEKTLVRRPLERVLKKYEVGSNALPAEIDLALAVLGLVVSRLQKPKTATFALKVKAWFVRLFFASKGEKLAATLRNEVGAPAGKGGAS